MINYLLPEEFDSTGNLYTKSLASPDTKTSNFLKFINNPITLNLNTSGHKIRIGTFGLIPSLEQKFSKILELAKDDVGNSEAPDWVTHGLSNAGDLLLFTKHIYEGKVMKAHDMTGGTTLEQNLPSNVLKKIRYAEHKELVAMGVKAREDLALHNNSPQNKKLKI